MAITLSSLITNTLLNLDEAANTPAGAEGTGTDNTDAVATTAALTGYFNDAGAILAKTCIPLEDTFTGTLPAHTRYIQMHTLTAAAQGDLWLPRSVSCAGTTLIYAAREALEVYNMGLTTAAEGIPKYWFFDGSTIGVEPVPAVNSALIVEGFAAPKPFGGGITSWTWLPDSDHYMIEWYGQIMVALKNAMDPQLGPRATIWSNLFDEARLQRYTHIPAWTRRYAFPNPPMRISAPAAEGGGDGSNG